MISNNISFGSKYKTFLNAKDIINDKKDINLVKHLEKNNIPYKENILDEKDILRQYYGTVSELTIVAPDEKDKSIETFCANKGIKFEKHSTSKSAIMRNIFNRIQNPEKGYVPVLIDSEKLEKFIENQTNNFKHTKNTYENYQKEETDFALKSGEKLNLSSIFIKYDGDDGSVESLKNYTDKFGVDRLNPHSVFVWMNNKDSNLNTYYGMKELGMKKIPVIMDMESYKFAEILGLINN